MFVHRKQTCAHTRTHILQNRSRFTLRLLAGSRTLPGATDSLYYASGPSTEGE